MSSALAAVVVAALSLPYMKPASFDHHPPEWEVIPSGHVQVGVGLHLHELPMQMWAFEFDLGPELIYDDRFTLRPAVSYGLDVNASRPVEQFASAGLGIGLRVPYVCSFEYLPAVQLGAFRSAFEPAFRHSLSWHMFYYVGFSVQHYVTGTNAELGHPRQALRVMFSVDVARLLAYRFM